MFLVPQHENSSTWNLKQRCIIALIGPERSIIKSTKNWKIQLNSTLIFNYLYAFFCCDRLLYVLEQNLSKNLSKVPAFFWQPQIQIWPHYKNTDEKEKSYIDNLLVYILWHEFSNNFDVQSDFGQKFAPWYHTNLKHALIIAREGLFTSWAKLQKFKNYFFLWFFSNLQISMVLTTFLHIMDSLLIKYDMMIGYLLLIL